MKRQRDEGGNGFVSWRVSSFLIFLWISCLLGSAGLAKPAVETGAEILAADGFSILKGKRVGLITNHTGVISSGKSTMDLFREAGVHVVALFGPEHGLYGADLAGVEISNTVDKRTGLPVFSLHGETRKPTPAMLKGIQVLVYDIQDIGCRSYTYISTMGLAMEAAGEAGIEFVVLDRPNPLGGERVEGMPLDPRYRSFVSQWDIPYVYGMTAGELAKMIVGERWLVKAPRLTVIPMQGWRRSMTWEETGLIWVPTSPNIPTSDSALCYVITGLIGELAVVNTGIGYTIPFGVIGHPSMEAFDFSARLNQRRVPGIYFRPLFYQPFYGSLKGQMCQGVQIQFTDRRRAALVPASMQLMEFLYRMRGQELFSKVPRGEKISLFEKICGSPEIRNHFESGAGAEKLLKSWEPFEKEFRSRREKYLIYP